jgi:hypothetical protein
VQLIDFDEPKIKPNPLATLQLNVPTFTALCADAGAASAAIPAIAVKRVAVRRIIFDITLLSLMSDLTAPRLTAQPWQPQLSRRADIVKGAHRDAN